MVSSWVVWHSPESWMVTSSLKGSTGSLCISGIVGSAFATLCLTAGAAEFTGYGVLTSDYVHRGVSYSDGHAAAQVGGDIEFDSGVYLGVWGSTVDIDNGPGRHRDLQLNYYVGYSHDLGTRWSIGANVVAHTFPGTTGEIDYSYEEFSLSINYRDILWLEYSWSPDLFDTGYEARNFELLFEWPLTAGFVLGAGAGYYDPSELTGSGYGYWQLGVSRPLGIIDVDLSFHDTNRWVPIVSDAERAEQRLSLSARITF